VRANVRNKAPRYLLWLPQLRAIKSLCTYCFVANRDPGIVLKMPIRLTRKALAGRRQVFISLVERLDITGEDGRLDFPLHKNTAEPSFRACHVLAVGSCENVKALCDDRIVTKSVCSPVVAQVKIRLRFGLGDVFGSAPASSNSLRPSG